LGGMVILTITSGLGFFGHTLLLDPLGMEFGWSKGTVSSAVTILLFVSAVSGSILGGFIDRHGPSTLLVLGSGCMGLGFMLLGRIQELWHLYAVYMLLGIGTSATHMVPVSTVVANWFVRKRGLAMSVAMSGLSLGGVLLVPAASWLLRGWGLRATLFIFGLTFWIVIIPIAVLVVKKKPEMMGLCPDGDPPQGAQHRGGEAFSTVSEPTTPWTRKEAMSRKAFWSIAFAFFLVLSGQVAFMIHEVSFLSPMLGSVGAATAVSLTTGASFLGRFLVGSFVDRADKRWVAAVCFLLQGGAVFTAAHSTHTGLLYVCVVVFGLTMGNIIMMQPLIIAEFFGVASFGKVSGMIMLFTSSGSAFAPMISGYLFDLSGSYVTSFTLFSSAYLLAAVVVLAARSPSPAPLCTEM